jgi:hypothetical protein
MQRVREPLAHGRRSVALSVPGPFGFLDLFSGRSESSDEFPSPFIGAMLV